jgi:hypothetical protein
MQIKKAASVFPDPVGAEISVVLPAKISGQPSCCGSVGVPKQPMNQSRTSGCAHSRPQASGSAGPWFISRSNYSLRTSRHLIRGWRVTLSLVSVPVTRRGFGTKSASAIAFNQRATG